MRSAETRDSRPRVLVTGAAGGLGRDVAVQLSQRGVSLGIADINGAELAATGALCRANGAACEEIVTDLALAGAPEAAVQRVVDRWLGIDILVNNAAVSRIEPFLATTRLTWETTFDVNVIALAMASLAAGKVMKGQGGGRIVNLTSPSSRMSIAEYVAYAASKAAVDSITRSVAAALGPFGILVNSLSPGMMDTDIQRSTELELARLNQRDDVEAFRAERTRRIPLGRRPSVAETAAMVVWLCLDAPPYMTAERMNMSGGLEKD